MVANSSIIFPVMGLDTDNQGDRITQEMAEPAPPSSMAVPKAASLDELKASMGTPDLTATTGVIPQKESETLPFAALLPGALTKRHAMQVLDGVFQPEARGEKQHTPEMSSTSCYQWASWFAQYPISSADKSLEDAEKLLSALYLGITRLQTAIPEEIKTGVQKLKTILTAYGTEYYHMVQTNRTQDIAGLQQRVFSSQEFMMAARVIEELKRFGQSIYAQLAETTAKEERKAYLRTAEGKVISERYPQFAKSYELAPDKVETAKKRYEEKLEQAVRKQLSHTDEENALLLQQQFSPENIARFIALKSSQFIQKAVEEIRSRLSSEEEAKLYENLPVNITSMRKSEHPEEVYVIFGTDQKIPDGYGSEFQLLIAQGLLKAKALVLASHGNQEENIHFLQHFGHVMKGNGGVQFTQDQNACIHLKHETKGGKFDAGNFYTPIASRDADFFADYLVLAQKNGNIEGLKRTFQMAMETSFSQGRTMMAYGQAAELKIKFFKNLELLGQRQKPENSKQEPVYVGETGEAIAMLDDLQTRALCVLALKDRTITEQGTELREAKRKIDAHLGEKLEFGNRATAEVRAAEQQTAAAREDLKKERLRHIQLLQQLRAKTGVMSRDIAAMIDAELKDLENPKG